jgi:hypothetical protein
MALWLCRLDAPQAGATCGVGAWLLPTDLSPDGMEQPSRWELYQRSGTGLPFGLDCHLVAPLTPAQERRIGAQLSPWLVQERSLRLQGRPVLLVRGAAHFSHRRFGPRRLRLALNSALMQCGCDRPVLLLCWQNDPVHDADAVVDGVVDPPADSPLNYEVFLREAHHRGEASGPWRIPAVLAPADPDRSPFLNASAERYSEWLQLESRWSEFRLQGAADAPVVLGSWLGHQRWWREPETTPPATEPPPPSPAAPAAQPLHLSWGTQQPGNLALLVHGFHQPELRRILQKVSPDGHPDIDLYLSVPEDHFGSAITLLEDLAWPRVQLFGGANRGRDIAPFLLRALPAAIANNHQQFVKVHTKRSTHLGDGEPWGAHLLNSLLAPSFLQQLASELESNSQLGLLAPAGTLLPCTLSLGRNSHQLLALCQRHELEPRSVLSSRFIAGTMMAGRLAALWPMLEHPPSLEDFDAEAGQTDGTLAHAYERWIGVQAERHGWQIQELPGNAAAVPHFSYGWAEHPPAANRDS